MRGPARPAQVFLGGRPSGVSFLASEHRECVIQARYSLRDLSSPTTRVRHRRRRRRASGSRGEPRALPVAGSTTSSWSAPGSARAGAGAGRASVWSRRTGACGSPTIQYDGEDPDGFKPRDDIVGTSSATRRGSSSPVRKVSPSARWTGADEASRSRRQTGRSMPARCSRDRRVPAALPAGEGLDAARRFPQVDVEGYLTPRSCRRARAGRGSGQSGVRSRRSSGRRPGGLPGVRQRALAPPPARGSATAPGGSRDGVPRGDSRVAAEARREVGRTFSRAGARRARPQPADAARARGSCSSGIRGGGRESGAVRTRPRSRASAGVTSATAS